jgi:hypothetical protein
MELLFDFMLFGVFPVIGLITIIVIISKDKGFYG